MRPNQTGEHKREFLLAVEILKGKSPLGKQLRAETRLLS
jgi:hypothetical protein